jgi:hypothetical protein
VVTTEVWDLAGASTNTGAKRLGSRFGGRGSTPGTSPYESRDASVNSYPRKRCKERSVHLGSEDGT